MGSTTLMAVVLALILGPGISSADPPVQVSILERDGTLHPAPGYRPALVGPEYTSNPSTYGPDDTFVQDEVILRFRSGVTTEQQNALMASYGMRFGRAIYGDRAIVAKVPVGTARGIAQALRGHPLLEMVGLNFILRLQYDPNDPLYPQQQHLDRDHINAPVGWDYGQGLGAISLVAIVDSGMDAGGSDNVIHPDFVGKFREENWQTFISATDDRFSDPLGHGTHVGGLAATGTDNGVGTAGTGFSAWPMSLKVSGRLSAFSEVASAVNWASDHGASSINMSLGCKKDSECPSNDPGILLLKEAVDRAYARGITVVAAAGNYGHTHPVYPVSFRQLSSDPWPYNEKLVIATAATISNTRTVYSSYGTWIDVAAPGTEDGNIGLLSTYPTERPAGPYNRLQGTSVAAPQVAGLAVLLTSLGYSNTEVYTHIMSGTTDLLTPGYDIETGWGRINMGGSMSRAARPRCEPGICQPGMAVVPNEGRVGMQWFNFQGSGFSPSPSIQVERYAEICYAPPGGEYQCVRRLTDKYGVAGLSIQIASDVTGMWSVYMRDVFTGATTPVKTFTVLP